MIFLKVSAAEPRYVRVMNSTHIYRGLSAIIFAIVCLIRSSAADVASLPDPATPDFRSQLESARQLRDPIRHSEEFGRTLRQWTERDPDAALGYVDQLPRDADYTQGLLLVLRSVAVRDPDRVLALARPRGVTAEQAAFYNSFFADLARKDVAAAVPQLAQVPAGIGRSNAIRAVVDVWAAKDFPAAFDWARDLPSPEDREVAVESALLALVEKEPLRAFPLARENLAGPALERVGAGAVRALMAMDPDAAAGLVMTLPAGEARTLAVIDVARGLAARDPARAAVWIGTLRERKLSRLALNGVLEIWVGHDPVAAGNYVVQMDPGAAQDAAAGQYARIRGARSRQETIDWAGTLTSPSAREAAFKALGVTDEARGKLSQSLPR